MTDLNNVVLMGNLTRDVDFSYVGNGIPKAELSIAVNRSRKVNETWTNEVSYFPVTYMGKNAESIKNYLTKGTRVTVAGEIIQDRYESKDGEKKSKIYIFADRVYLCSSKNGVTAPVNEQPQQSEEIAEDIPF